jgi:hypothetical protein
MVPKEFVHSSDLISIYLGELKKSSLWVLARGENRGREWRVHGETICQARRNSPKHL